MRKRNSRSKHAGGDDPLATHQPTVGDEAWIAEHHPCFESTDDYTPDREPIPPSPWQIALGETFKKVEEENERMKDPHLWSADAANDRPLSGLILEPIRQALRAQGLTRVNAVTAPRIPMADSALLSLFGEGLGALEQLLGRLVLDAVITGDHAFKDQVDDAVKDADKLFHRGRSPGGTINEAFFCWWHHDLTDEERGTMTIGKVKNAVARKLRRAKELSPTEWKRLKRDHPELQRLPKARAGRPSKPLKEQSS